MCSRTVLGELKNLRSQKIPFRLRRRLEQSFCKACHIICLQLPCWFCWMRKEVADKWFAVVVGFVASSLRIIFVGQTAAGCWCILLFSARGFATSWRNVNILVLLRRWSMFSSHTAYNFVALYVLPGMHFIATYLLYLLCQETISFGRRNYIYKRCKIKVFSLE